MIGCHVGDCSRASAQQLWQSLPAVYRQCAKVYTDCWEAYVTVFPSNRHVAVGKESGLTNYIERRNNTMRQRVSRLVTHRSAVLERCDRIIVLNNGRVEMEGTFDELSKNYVQ